MTSKDLKNSILQLAVQGRLVPQNPDDEPASELLKRIRAEKLRLNKERIIKKGKSLPPISEDEKPFEIPESWEWVRLGTICDYGTCQSQTDIPLDAWLLDLEDIEKDTGRLLNRIKAGNRKSLSSKHVFRKGMVLYSKLRTYLNKVLVADMDGYCTSEILPLDFGKDVDAGYARLVLMSPFFLDYTAQCGYGMKMPRFGTEDGRRALFPLPPLAEQKHIVTKIEELMPLVEEYGKVEERLSALNAELPDALRQSILQQAIQGKLTRRDPDDEPASELLKRIRAEKARLLKSGKIRKEKPLSPITEDELPFEIPAGWAWVRLREVLVNISTGPFGSMLHKSDYCAGGVPLVNPMNIQDGKIIPSKKMCVSQSTAKRLSQYRLSRGMVVVARRGELGRCASIGEQEDGWLCGTGSFFLVPSKNLYIPFITLIISSPFARRIFAGTAIGTTMANLNHKLLGELPFPLPPIAEQERIVSRVNELLGMCDALKAVANPTDS
jgi:type I restriction enzyme S subunit